MVKAHKDLTDFYIREGDTIRLQPCVSPVWDTGIALHALAEAGLTPAPTRPRRGTAWLLCKECRFAGDWQRNVGKHVEPSGWFFEFENPYYPDTDDTAMALTSLKRLGGPEAAGRDRPGRAVAAGVPERRRRVGGVRQDPHREVLEHIPFADHNAMQDPCCPDIAGRVLESLGYNGLRGRPTPASTGPSPSSGASRTTAGRGGAGGA